MYILYWALDFYLNMPMHVDFVPKITAKTFNMGKWFYSVAFEIKVQ